MSSYVREAMYCRTILENKLHKLNGKECENFISEILSLEIPKIIHLKPDGSEGDWGTDMIDVDGNCLYQVFAPEYRDSSTNLSSAKIKMKKDFERSFKKWTAKGFLINKWVFVFNDKFQGVYPSLVTDQLSIKRNYNLQEAQIMISKDIIDIGVNQYVDESRRSNLYSIIGRPFISITDRQIDDFDELSPMFLVCDSLLAKMSKTTFINNHNSHMNLVEVERKIEINKLTPIISSKILSFLDRISIVSELYDDMDDYAQEQIRDIIINTYYEECSKTNDSNLIYINLYDNFAIHIPDNHLSHISLSLVMAFHFEICDIFSREETP